MAWRGAGRALWGGVQRQLHSRGISGTAARLQEGAGGGGGSKGQLTFPFHEGPTKVTYAPGINPEEVAMAERGAAVATRLMFPWERGQIDGSEKLGQGTKVYWYFFGTILGTYGLYSWYTNDPVAEQKKKDEKAAKLAAIELGRREAWKDLASGKSFMMESKDPYDGLTPQEIDDYLEARRKEELDEKISQSQARFQKFVESADSEDPYDGMSPQEINALQAAGK